MLVTTIWKDLNGFNSAKIKLGNLLWYSLNKSQAVILFNKCIDINIDSLQNNLDFNINTVILYAVYAIIMGDIEEIPNLDEIYDSWLKYKK